MAEAARPTLRPLAGLRIVDLSTLLPGPYCSHLLGQLGAEVIRVEMYPEGDPVRRTNPRAAAHYNHGKRSLCVDIRKPAGQAIVLDLARSADAFIEGFRPGVMARLGLGYEQVRAVNPQVIYCSLSGYGQDGPYAQYPGHDLNYLAAAGWFASGLEYRDDTLARPRLRVADLSASLFTALSISAWLRTPRPHRTATWLDASMVDSIASLALPAILSTPDAALRNPASRHDVVADNAVYTTRDGVPVSIATMEDKFWCAFAERAAPHCPALGNPAWRERRTRTQDKAAVAAALEQFFGSLDYATIAALLPPAEIPVLRVLRGCELLTDEHLAARGLLQGATTDPRVAYPVVADGTRLVASGALEHPGASNAALLRELGRSDADIAALTAAGVITELVAT